MLGLWNGQKKKGKEEEEELILINFSSIQSIRFLLNEDI